MNASTDRDVTNCRLTTSALASQTWLEDIRDNKLFGKEVRAGGSPLWNAHAIATINFPELVQPVARLSDAAQAHVQWVAHTALEKVEGKPQLPTDVQHTYGIYMQRLQRVIDEINRTASRERARNARSLDRFRINFHRFQAHIRQYVPRRISKEGERRKTDGA